MVVATSRFVSVIFALISTFFAPLAGATHVADGDVAGSAAMDFLWILGGFLVVAYLRRRDHWHKQAASADSARNKTSNAAPV